MEDPTNIPQVEEIMEFAGNRQQLLPNSLVKIKSGKDDSIRDLLHIFRKDTSIKEAFKNRPEYLLQIGLGWFWQAHDHMVSNVSLIKPISASTRSGSAADDSRINNLLPKQFLPVIEPLIVDEVAKEFNGRLCTLFFQLRHVDIINENSNGLVGPSTEERLSLFV